MPRQPSPRPLQLPARQPRVDMSTRIVIAKIISLVPRLLHVRIIIRTYVHVVPRKKRLYASRRHSFSRGERRRGLTVHATVSVPHLPHPPVYAPTRMRGHLDLVPDRLCPNAECWEVICCVRHRFVSVDCMRAKQKMPVPVYTPLSLTSRVRARHTLCACAPSPSNNLARGRLWVPL